MNIFDLVSLLSSLIAIISGLTFLLKYGPYYFAQPNLYIRIYYSRPYPNRTNVYVSLLNRSRYLVSIDFIRLLFGFINSPSNIDTNLNIVGWEQTGYMLHNGIRRQLGAYEIRLSPPNRMFIRLDREGWFDIIVLEFESKSPDVAIGYLRIECQLHVDPSDFYPMFPKIMDSILKRLRIRDHGVELEYIVLWPNPPRNTKLHPTKYLGQIEVYRGEELHP